jgi:hypothetical protein
MTFKWTRAFVMLLLPLALALVAINKASASPVDASYTVSGTSGDWTYDFSVTNNLGGTNDIYAFAVLLPTATLTTAPANWIPITTPTYKQWCYISCNTTGGVLPGQTLGGFDFHDTTPNFETTISFLATAFGGDLGNPSIPGVASAVPEPSTWAMLLLGFAGIGFMAYRRKLKPALMAA